MSLFPCSSLLCISSSLLSLVYCQSPSSVVPSLMSPFYFPVSLVYCLLSLVYCLSSVVSRPLSIVSSLLSFVLSLLSLVARLLSLVPRRLSLVSRLLSLVYYPSSFVYCPSPSSLVYCPSSLDSDVSVPHRLLTRMFQCRRLGRPAATPPLPRSLAAADPLAASCAGSCQLGRART